MRRLASGSNRKRALDYPAVPGTVPITMILSDWQATWHKPRPRGIGLTPISRYIRDKLFPKPSQLLPRLALLYGPAAFRKRACAWIAEVADMYPACLIGSRAVALMGIRTHLWSH